MPLQWTPEFGTDDRKIDQQHRQLFRFVNKIESCLAGGEVDPEEIEQLLHFLESYIRSHFQYEEACMLKRRCPVAKENHEAHRSFIEYFDAMTEQYRQRGYSKQWLESLHGFLQGWLSTHICQIDVQLRNCD